MAIDVHAHIVPPGLGPAVLSGAAPGAVTAERRADGLVFHMETGHRANPVVPALLDLDEREAWMERRGVAHQVVSVWADLYGYGLEEADGARWTRLVNEHLAAAVADRPRLSALATLPLQAPAEAVRMLRDARADGFVGAVIGTELPGRQLDDPALEPVFAAAAEHRVPLFVHPGYCRDERLGDHGLVNAVGRGVDTTIAIARLLFAGIPQRLEGLTLILAHGGGTLPYLLGRLAQNHAIVPGTADPVAGFQRLAFDTLVFDPAALRLLCTLAEPGNLMCGSDYPFSIGDLDPTRIIGETDLGEHTPQALLTDNAARIFGLPTPATTR